MAPATEAAPTDSTSVQTAVDPERYEEQLQAKIDRLKDLFGIYKTPELEVFRSEPINFRMRAEFRVWHKGTDTYYVMFEKPGEDSGAAAEDVAAAAEDVAAAAEPPTSPRSQTEPEADDPGGTQHPTTAASAAEEVADGASAHPAAASVASSDGGPAPQTGQAAAAAAADGAAANGEPLQSGKSARRARRRAARRVSSPPKRRMSRIRVASFPVASSLINQIMPLLREELIASPALKERLFQACFHSTMSNNAMVTLAYHKQLDDVWREAAAAARGRILKKLGPACVGLQLVGRARKQKVCLDVDHVMDVMSVGGRQYQYMQVEGAFSQPNGGVAEHMLTWALDVTRGSEGDLLELYCGNGNFTIPLAQNFRQVVATEVSKASVEAARHNIELNEVGNIFMARISSEEFTETWRAKGTRQRLKGLMDWEELRLNTLLVDPPRAGLDPATEQLLGDFERVVYISCNPETLAANLRGVVGVSHEIRRMAVFDQFPYTHHLECGVYLARKSG